MDYTKDFFGYNLVWFVGEVEDRLDPLYLGRVRVRCFGWHSSDKSVQPTEVLPWANSIGGQTLSGNDFTLGTWVFGFFMDGSKAQRPVVIGSLPGYRYGSPGQSELNPVGINEPDYPSALSGIRAENQKKDVIIDPEAGPEWDEPPDPEDAVYPTTKVFSHESGSFLMFTGSGRVLLWSASGTYIELQADGDGVWRIVGDGYRVVSGSDFINVAGNVNLTVDGNVNWNIGGNVTYNVGGDVNWIVKGNYDSDITGDKIEKITGNKDEDIAGNKTVKLGGDENVNAGGSIIRIGGPLYKIDASKVVIG